MADIGTVLELVKTYGLSLVAMGLLALWVVHLHRELAKCWEGRLVDAKAGTEALAANTAVLREFTEEAKARTQAQVTMARALELQAAELKTLRDAALRSGDL
jgi:hypothetical protein